jgi:hypothetical protein
LIWGLAVATINLRRRAAWMPGAAMADVFPAASRR